MRGIKVELYYYILKEKVKIGEQVVRLSKQEHIDSVLNMDKYTIIYNVEMGKHFVPKKIKCIKRSGEIENTKELIIENNKIWLPCEENEIWFSSNIYDNLQILFMAPLLINATESKNRIFTLFIIVYDLNIVALNGINSSKDSKGFCYEYLSPVKFYSSYNSNDFLLDYYLNSKEKIEIVRVYFNNYIEKGKCVMSEELRGPLAISKQLKLYKLSFVQVSLDGANSKSHDWLRNKQGAFDKAIEAIGYLKEAGLQVGVACTPSLKNINEIEDIIELCEKLGVNSFRMQPLMPLGRAVDNLKDYISNYENYKNIAQKLIKLKYRNLAFDKVIVEWGDPIDHLIRFRTILRDNNLALGINAYGDITVSPYIPLTLGNVKKHTLEEYWEKGLNIAWKIPVIEYISRQMLSCDRLCVNTIDNNLPFIYREDGIALDVIEDDVFNIPIDVVINKEQLNTASF